MKYTETHRVLMSLFDINKPQMVLPNSSMSIRTFDFTSTPLFIKSEVLKESNGFYPYADANILENNQFRYPVFFPDDKVYDSAILLLHGLNERSWDKYLAWASDLCQQTQKPVILFPISFHMNRSPKEWSNPRAMSALVEKRKQLILNSDLSCFANLALSERLSQNPLRFFTSGHQSANDLIQLIQTIKKGKHSHFKEDTKVDFFAYSIGAFLSQILFLANPHNLLVDSRLFMFCGGSVFSEMMGSSKLIMDQPAFERLHAYYKDQIDNELQSHPELNADIKDNGLWLSFLSMLSFDKLKQYQVNSFKRLSKQIDVVTLLKDRVIPARGILETLGLSSKSKNAEVLDFPYQYSHEVPFPIFSDPKRSTIVDQYFEIVFNRAALFLR